MNTLNRALRVLKLKETDALDRGENKPGDNGRRSGRKTEGDEYVDCAVGVGKPHHCEQNSSRRLERADDHLRKGRDDIRPPEREISDTGEREDLKCATTASDLV